MYAYFPFMFSTVATLMFISFVRAQQRKVKTTFNRPHELLDYERIKNIMTSTVIWSMMVTFPNATVRLFFSYLAATDYGQLILRLADSWIFTIHSLNFFFLLVSNRFFKQESEKLFKVKDIKVKLKDFNF